MNFLTWKTDVLKPLIDAIAARFNVVQGDLGGKEDVINKTSDGAFTTPTNTQYPTALAVKTYVDFKTQTAAQTAAQTPTAAGAYLTAASDVQAILDEHEGQILALNDSTNLADYFTTQLI